MILAVLYFSWDRFSLLLNGKRKNLFLNIYLLQYFNLYMYVFINFSEKCRLQTIEENLQLNEEIMRVLYVALICNIIIILYSFSLFYFIIRILLLVPVMISHSEHFS